MSKGGKLRVVQWATGNIGTRSLQAVIEHPRMELVGLYVSSPAKVGQDAGILAERAVTGVKAVGDIAEIIALKPDCVLYMRQGISYEEVCALLEAGINVVTTRGEFHNPRLMEPELRARVEAACIKGDSSIYSTGISPGFITEALPLAFLSIQRRLDKLTIDEYADMSRRPSPEMLFQVMGYGRPMGELDARSLHHIQECFSFSLAQVADAIGMKLDDVQVKGEMASSPQDITIAAGTIKAGTMTAQRITLTGFHKGRELLQFRANWYCTTDIDKDWDLKETGWRVQVEGDMPIDAEIRFPVPLEDYPKVMPGLTAHRAVNSVEALVAAAPGIRTTVDLPQVYATF